MAIAVLVGLAFVAYALGGNEYISPQGVNEPESSTETSGNNPPPNRVPDGMDAPATGEGETSNIIEFTNRGFSQQAYRVPAGSTVTVQNNSSRPLQFSSDDHPAHTDEPALNTPTIRPGETTTFVAPDAPGEYGFHNHINARFTGVLVVE